MATGDGIIKYGAYATCQGALSIASGAINTTAPSNLTTAIPAEDDYFLLDFKVQITVTAPAAAGGTVDIYRRAAGAQQTPSATYLQQYVGSVVVNNAIGDYYLYGVPNNDKLDTFYAWNATGTTTTIALQVRGRTYITE